MFTLTRTDAARKLVDDLIREAWYAMHYARRYGTRGEADAREYALRDLLGIRRELMGRGR